MSSEERVRRTCAGAFNGCLVDGDPAENARERKIKRRAIGIRCCCRARIGDAPDCAAVCKDRGVDGASGTADSATGGVPVAPRAARRRQRDEPSHSDSKVSC